MRKSPREPSAGYVARDLRDRRRIGESMAGRAPWDRPLGPPQRTPTTCPECWDPVALKPGAPMCASCEKFYSDPLEQARRGAFAVPKRLGRPRAALSLLAARARTAQVEKALARQRRRRERYLAKRAQNVAVG